MRGGAWNRIMENCDRSRRGLFPVAPGHLAFDGVGQDHAQRRPELPSGYQPRLLLPASGPRRSGLTGPFVEDGAFPARSTHQVQARVYRPAALLYLLRTVIVAVRDADGKKVW